MSYLLSFVLLTYTCQCQWLSLGLHAKCPVFLSSFNNVCIFLVDSNRNLRHQISRKSVQWQASRYMRQTDSQVGTWRALFTTLRTLLRKYIASVRTPLKTTDIRTHILNNGTRLSWVVSLTLRLLYYRRKSHRTHLTFRHRASCILGQAFHYTPENAFYIFKQQIYFIIWYLLDRASLI